MAWPWARRPQDVQVLNNFIRPEEVFATNGADALRQWGAMGGSPGNDIMFQWKEITAASRFQQKLWSIFRFSLPLIAKVDATPGQVDRWLLGELDRLVIRATKAMDAFQFDETMKAIRGFAWRPWRTIISSWSRHGYTGLTDRRRGRPRAHFTGP